jgi:hypothetical protein
MEKESPGHIRLRTHNLSESDRALPPVNTIVKGTTNYTLQHDLNWAYADSFPVAARWKKFRGISTMKHEKTKEWQMSIFKQTTNFTKFAACNLQCAAGNQWLQA